MNLQKRGGRTAAESLRKLCLLYGRHWRMILLSALACATLVLLYTRLAVTPLYRATVSMYVNNAGGAHPAETGGRTGTSEQMLNTYIRILSSDRVLNRTAEAIDWEDITAASLRRMLTVSLVEDTEIFSISVTYPDPVMAADMANVLAQIGQEEIAKVVEGSSAQVIDSAAVPEARCFPSYPLNTLAGCAAGVLLALAWVTLRFLLDVRVKDEEDLKRVFALPVLGTIPTFDPSGGRRSAYVRSGSAGGRKRV